MKITCQKCGQNYRVDEKKIPPGVSSIKCRKCGHTVSLEKSEAGESSDRGRPAAEAPSTGPPGSAHGTRGKPLPSKPSAPNREPAPKPGSAKLSQDILKIACPKCERVYSIRKDRMPEGVPFITCRSCHEKIPVDTDERKRCEKCGYRRSQQDDALSSGDACPKCGLVYEKTGSYLMKKEGWQKEETEKSGLYIHQDSAPQLKKPLFIGGAFIIAMVVLFTGYGLIESLVASFESDVDADFQMSEELALANRSPVFIGPAHVAFVHEDGTVRTWGRNRWGQLGDGSVSHRSEPVTAVDLDHVVSVSGSARFTLALRDDGTVWAWGINVNGQLGDGSGKSRGEPVPVADLADIVAVSAGDFHSMALGKNGRVWTWGQNGRGQLGYAGSDAFSPKMVPGIGSAIAVSAGSVHSVVLRSDGTVWGWGSNDKGQLGLGFVSRKTVLPVQVPDFEAATRIAAGGNSTFAIKKDGTVWGWGSNLNGRLGDGSFADRRAPVRVADIRDIVSVSPGKSHTLALTDEGTVWAWGENSEGQLGIGSKKTRNRPVRVARQIRATFVFAGDQTSMALDDTNAAWAWGSNKEGQIGDGGTGWRMFPKSAPYYDGIRETVLPGLRLSGNEEMKKE